MRVWELTHGALLELIDVNAAVHGLTFATACTLIVGGSMGLIALEIHVGGT